MELLSLITGNLPTIPIEVFEHSNILYLIDLPLVLAGAGASFLGEQIAIVNTCIDYEHAPIAVRVLSTCYTAVVRVICCRCDGAARIFQTNQSTVRTRRSEIGAGALGIICSWSCLDGVGRGCCCGSGGRGRGRSGNCGIIGLRGGYGGADVVRIDS